MSIRDDKVIFDVPKVKRGFAFFALLGIIELVFSFFLMLSLAGRIFAPQTSEAAPGVPQLISFQGRLTDTSGNPLGGTGQLYCFRYSVYDAQAGGNKLWPTGTPGTSTTTVIDGVFSDQIGRVDTLDYDFVSTSTLFLQLDVNTVTSTCAGSWELLSPRQQLTSAPYAQSSENIYGNALRTPTSTKVQVGTGAGVVSGPTLFSLDVVSSLESIGGTCNNNNGTMWYNSALSRALVCENNTIQTLSNSSTTIAGIGTNGSSSITAGSIVFSNSNGVSFGQNGSTITASVNAGGGANVTYLTYQDRQLGASTQSSAGQNSLWLTPFRIPNGVYISGSSIQLMQSLSGSASTGVSAQTNTVGETLRWALFSNDSTNPTSFNSWVSGSLTFNLWNSGTVSASWGYNGNTSSSAGTRILTQQAWGVRMLNLPLNSSVGPGIYLMGFALSTATSGNSSLLRTAGIIMDNPVPLAMGNNFGSVTATSIGFVDAGTYSVTTGAMPSGIGLSEIRQRSNVVPYFKIGAI